MQYALIEVANRQLLIDANEYPLLGQSLDSVTDAVEDEDSMHLKLVYGVYKAQRGVSEEEAMAEAEMFLGRAIERGEWKNSGFEQTIAGQMADEISRSFLDKPLNDELTTEEKILLLDKASQVGREELTSCIIAMLPAELHMYASSAHDYTCTCS